MISVTLTIEQWGLIRDALDVAYGEKPGRLAVAVAWVEIDEAVGRVAAKEVG